MGYNNYHKLKIIINTDEIRKEPKLFCDKCKILPKSGKFCPECGNPLTYIQVEKPYDIHEIIKEFRSYSDDASFLLNKTGNTNEPGSGHTIQDDLKEFSKRYPDLIFQLHVDWDQGFGDPPSRYYYFNGEKQEAKSQVVFEKCKFLIDSKKKLIYENS